MRNIVLVDALKLRLGYKPETCNNCWVLCTYCNYHAISKNGKIVPIYDTVIRCDECRYWFGGDEQYCPGVDHSVELDNEPICTEYEILKKLLEVI